MVWDVFGNFPRLGSHRPREDIPPLTPDQSEKLIEFRKRIRSSIHKKTAAKYKRMHDELRHSLTQILSPILIVRVQYFVRGGFVGHRSRASSKHVSPHLPVDGARFLGGQKGVALHLQDARVGVGSTKKPTPLDVDVRRSDVTAVIG
ncbi:uncharacterized protein TNCV_4022221 [Trichonephila clavipes]|nr:uncharacterized protein TNCV_4022221 [Trichonephila clavipes]